jgi:hypothetical protein
MSHSSPSTDQEPLANDSGEARPLADSVVVNPLAAVLTPIRILGFWTAVALPFLYLPLLVVGIESASRATAFLGLLALDVLALLIGRSHKLD